MPTFSSLSLYKLNTCHPLLQKLFHEVIKHRDCSILCGHRGKEEQEKAFTDGFSNSHWGQSNHNYVPSLAVDVVPYPIDWNNINRFYEFAGFVQGIALMKGIPIQWGGRFQKFDGPHYELIGVTDAKIPE